MEREKLDPKYRTFFIKNEKLLFDEDEEIEYKNYTNLANLPEDLAIIIKKTICGFLNNKGGRIYLGISDDKLVKGNTLTDKEQDTVKNNLLNLTSCFYPKCRKDKIRIDYIPVKDNDEFILNNFVVKIIVKQGDTSRLYSMSNKNFQCTFRSNGMVQFLDCEEIEREIFKRKQTPGNIIEENLFDDIIPVKPIYKELEISNVDNNFFIKNLFSDVPRIRNKVEFDKNNEKSITLIISNLPNKVSYEDIDNLFKEYRIMCNITIESRSFCKTSIALITLFNMDEAIKARNKLNGFLFRDNKLNVKIHNYP